MMEKRGSTTQESALLVMKMSKKNKGKIDADF